MLNFDESIWYKKKQNKSYIILLIKIGAPDTYGKAKAAENKIREARKLGRDVKIGNVTRQRNYP